MEVAEVDTMIEPSVLRAMLAAGATAEMIVAAVEADYAIEREKLLERREKDRQRKQRSRHAESDGQGVTSEDGAGQKESSPTPPQRKTTPPDIPPKGGISTPHAAKPKGSRLPADWEPQNEDWLWAQRELGLSDDVLRFETGSFRDHFHGAPGQRGIKLDWRKTWRNWMREAVRRGVRGRGPPRKSRDPMGDAADEFLRQEEARRYGH